MFEELVFQARTRLIRTGTTARSDTRLVKEGFVLGNMVDGSYYCIDVIRSGKRIVPFGKEAANRGEQPRSLLFGELGTKGVNGNVECPSVGFKSKDAGHDLRSGSRKSLAELVEIFQVGFVQGVTDNLNVEVIKILC